ncbi:hypothetical protein ANO14919_141860 [Xylariales sp. No.14919]|nr:hypothetical protein ANO14919_141860 [Xylariales sp. No.14919]
MFFLSFFSLLLAIRGVACLLARLLAYVTSKQHIPPNLQASLATVCIYYTIVDAD